MAVLNYTQNAALGAYQTWLMEQGVQACLDRIPRPQDPPGAPSALCGPYAQVGSQIRYTVRTTLPTATVSFSGQFRTASGNWQNTGETLTATSVGGVSQIVRPAATGSFASMVASVGAATVGAGEVYVVAELGRQNNGAFTPYAVLFKGYPESNAPLDLCAGTFLQNPPSTGGGGTCVCPTTFALQGFDIDVGGQAAFATRTPAAGTKERLIVAVVTATLLAGGPNRGLRFDWRDLEVGMVGIILTGNVLAPNNTYSMNGYLGVGQLSIFDRFYHIPMPESLYLREPYNMASDIENFQTGDEITDTYAVIEITS